MKREIRKGESIEDMRNKEERRERSDREKGVEG